MADDIIGHDHLDHGKHLHKKHHHHPPRLAQRPEHVLGIPRGNKPYHVGLPTRVRRKYGASEHQAEHAEPGHVHSPHCEHHQHPPVWKRRVIIALIALPVAALFYRVLPGLALALLIVAVDAFVEFHKVLTSGMPLDLEVLSTGAAYLAAAHGIGYALLVAVLGPIAAELAHGHLSEYLPVKVAALFVVSGAAWLLGLGAFQLMLAVLFGLLVQYFAMLTIAAADPITNFIRRLTNFGLQTYLIFGLLPLLHAYG